MIYQQILSQARARLSQTSDTPQLDAEVLLAHLLQKERIWLHAHSYEKCSESLQKQYEARILRRSQGEPVAYITGVREFYGREFVVTPAVLIPRPETELLVEKALVYLQSLPSSADILELGTGSGCILLTILQEWQCSTAMASDISPEAIAVASENAKRFSLLERVAFIESNWFQDIPSQQFDCIVSNPPYVASDAELEKELSYEPSSALFAEDDGLEDLEYLIRASHDFLKPGGKLFLECGQGQWARFMDDARLFHGYTSEVHCDLQGIERVIECTRGG